MVLLTSRRVLLLRLIAQAESVWSSEANSCIVLYTERSFANVIVTLMEDSVLLILMFSGLRRYKESRTVGIWRLLYRQVSGPPLHLLKYERLWNRVYCGSFWSPSQKYLPL